MATQLNTDDAFEFLKDILRTWGLLELADNVKRMLVEGVPSEVVPLQLRETKEYEKRFAANIQRQKRGLQVLSEAEFIATETALKTVVRRFVGEGEYDNRQWTDKWLSNDLSPQELTDRLNLWADSYDRQPVDWKNAWHAHGLTRADVLRGALDPGMTETKLKRRMGGMSISAEAFRSYGADNLNVAADRFEDYAAAGIDTEQARDAFGEVASREERESMLAGISGQTLGRLEQEKAELFGGAEQKKRQKILGQEQARFEENYVGSQSSLRRDPRGSY